MRDPGPLNAPVNQHLPIGPDAPWLAPLAGFSDLPFRLLCREQGAAAACTEMVSAKGLVYGMRQKKNCDGKSNEGTEDLLITTPEDAPLVVQLFGAEPEFLTEATLLLRERGYAWFDLNMGCSVPKVTKTGAGAALLREPARALAAASALFRAAGPGKAGCKLRLGWDAASPVYLDIAKALEDAGAAWITLHPRYARQGFSGEADLRALERLARTVAIPVLASGDLFRASDAFRCLEAGARGVMFARGAMANPAIFRQYHALRRMRLGSGPVPAQPLSLGDAAKERAMASGAKQEYTTAESAAWERPGNVAAPCGQTGTSNAGESCHAAVAPALEPLPASGEASEPLGRDELLALILRHADLARALTPGRPGRGGYAPALLKMRTVAPRYVRHLPGAKRLRLALTRCESWEELDDILRRFFIDAEKAPPL